MGFNDQEIVALSGAHALGRCHTDRSGFEGPWTFSPTSMTNEYYKLLLNEKCVMLYIHSLFLGVDFVDFTGGRGESGTVPSSTPIRRPALL